MDPDSKSSTLLRLAPIGVGMVVILCATVLAFLEKITESGWTNSVSVVVSLVFGARTMMLPSATTTTKQTDPSGSVTETKTQQPLGMAAPVAIPVAPTVAPPPSATPTTVTIVNPDPVPVDVVQPPKGPTP